MSTRSRPPTDETKTKIFDSKAPRSKQPTQRGHQTGSFATSELDGPAPPPQPAIRNTTEPLRIISMKQPPDAAAREKAEKQANPAKEHKAELRALSDVLKQGIPATQGQMGYLAPPRDAKGVRARKLRDTVFWGSLVVIVGCAVMLVVWFLAR